MGEQATDVDAQGKKEAVGPTVARAAPLRSFVQTVKLVTLLQHCSASSLEALALSFELNNTLLGEIKLGNLLF